MKRKILSKRASTAIAVSLILGSLLAGAIITGTLVARNYKLNNNYITFQEAIDIAMQFLKLQHF